MTDPKADPAALLERWIDAIDADDLLVVDPPDLESAVRVAGATHKGIRFVCRHWGVHRALDGAGLLTSFGTGYPTEPADGAVVFLPKGKERVKMTLETLAAHLPRHAPLWLVGPKRGGAGSARPLLEAFCETTSVESGKHCKLIRANVAERPPVQSLDDYQEVWSLELPEAPLRIVSLPGVFGHGHLDAGTAMLLPTLSDVTGRVADIGCGAGVVGAVLAARGSQVLFADVDAFALEATRRTLRLNRLESLGVVPSDALDDVAGRWNHIVSNPPFHSGFATDHTVTRRIVDAAPERLSPGGALTLVVNRFLPVADALEARFGAFDVLAEDGRYRVYRARLSAPGAAGRR